MLLFSDCLPVLAVFWCQNIIHKAMQSTLMVQSTGVICVTGVIGFQITSVLKNRAFSSVMIYIVSLKIKGSIYVLLLQNRSGTVNIMDKCCWVPDGINVMLMWSSSAHNRSFTAFEDTHHWCELVQICPLQSHGSCKHGLHVSRHVLYQLILVMIQIYKGYMVQIAGMQGLWFGQMGSRPCRTQREGHFHHKPRLWELF